MKERERKGRKRAGRRWSWSRVFIKTVFRSGLALLLVAFLLILTISTVGLPVPLNIAWANEAGTSRPLDARSITVRYEPIKESIISVESEDLELEVPGGIGRVRVAEMGIHTSVAQMGAGKKLPDVIEIKGLQVALDPSKLPAVEDQPPETDQPAPSPGGQTPMMPGDVLGILEGLFPLGTQPSRITLAEADFQMADSPWGSEPLRLERLDVFLARRADGVEARGFVNAEGRKVFDLATVARIREDGATKLDLHLLEADFSGLVARFMPEAEQGGAPSLFKDARISVALTGWPLVQTDHAVAARATIDFGEVRQLGGEAVEGLKLRADVPDIFMPLARSRMFLNWPQYSMIFQAQTAQGTDELSFKGEILKVENLLQFVAASAQAASALDPSGTVGPLGEQLNGLLAEFGGGKIKLSGTVKGAETESPHFVGAVQIEDLFMKQAPALIRGIAEVTGHKAGRNVVIRSVTLPRIEASRESVLLTDIVVDSPARLKMEKFAVSLTEGTLDLSGEMYSVGFLVDGPIDDPDIWLKDDNRVLQVISSDEDW